MPTNKRGDYAGCERANTSKIIQIMLTTLFNSPTECKNIWKVPNHPPIAQKTV